MKQGIGSTDAALMIVEEEGAHFWGTMLRLHGPLDGGGARTFLLREVTSTRDCVSEADLSLSCFSLV